MLQSFLQELVGLPLAEAEKRVVEAGHLTEVLPEDTGARALIAIPNAVILWQADGKVIFAEAGDPYELEV